MGPIDWIENQYDNGKEFVNDVENTARDTASETAENATPDWASELMDAEILGYGLIDSPVAFVQAVFVDMLAGGILSFAGAIAVLILDTWNILTGAFVDAGVALLDPFGAIAGVPISILGIINETIVTTAAVAGPGAPFVAALLWAVVVFVVALAVRAILEVAPLVIPWL